MFEHFFKKKEKSFISGDSKSPEFALHMLKTLEERHTPAIVNFKGDAQQYVTMILEVNEKDNTIMLDELTPEEGHKKAISKSTFRISSSDHGIAVIFRTHVVDHGRKDGIAFYNAALPQSVEYCQRREAFRLKLSQLDKKPIKIKIKGKEYNDAYFFDISFTGMSFIVPEQNLTDLIARGQSIESCIFKLDEPDETRIPQEINCQLELRRLSYDDQKKQSILACKFLKLDRHQQRLLNIYICNLERQELRKDLRE